MSEKMSAGELSCRLRECADNDWPIGAADLRAAADLVTEGYALRARFGGIMDALWDQYIGADRDQGHVVIFCEMCEADGGVVDNGAQVSWRDVPHTELCLFGRARAALNPPQEADSGDNKP